MKKELLYLCYLLDKYNKEIHFIFFLIIFDAKQILEKNATPEFIDAKKQLDAKYSQAKKQMTEIPVQKTKNILQEQINNIEISWRFSIHTLQLY